MTKYRGMHPVSPHVGEFCYVDVLHVHRVSPPDMRVYVHMKTGEYLFVGDQVAAGYDGSKFAYFGPHLVHDPALAETQRIFCYLAGAHYHAYPSPSSPDVVLKDGVSWHLGEAQVRIRPPEGRHLDGPSGIPTVSGGGAAAAPGARADPRRG